METIVRSQRSRTKQNLFKKITLIGALVLVLIVTSVIIWGYLQLKKPLPVIEGTIQLSGLQETVTVWRDENGVPHIEAKNENDLYFAQGYVTAQDRLFQMDLGRRQASGMLSEVIGEATVENDKFFRTFGLRRSAEGTIDHLSEGAIMALTAYADGVNAFIHEAKEEGTLPIEFRFMGYEPTPWTVVDSITLGKYMAYDLGGNWESQMFRHYLVQNFSEEEALELFPTYPAGGPHVLDLLKAHTLDFSKSFAYADSPNLENGSNNWVISGEKTASGKPLLADDPHLGLATPSIWYETHLKSPEVNVTGVIFAGIPGIIVGHNEHIAWGVTNVGPDVQQLYIEKRNPDNPYEFEYMGNWEKAEVIKEELKIKGEESIEFDVVITRRGPIISEFAHDDQPDSALSLRWTAHDPTPELDAVLRFNKASNWEEFEDALRYFHAPAQNFVFASTDGTIAYRANGLIPIRKTNEALLPVPGWTDEHEWQGYIPWEDLPTIINPDGGFIATANNKIVDDNYPYHIAHSWAQPFRQQRIVDVLSSKDVMSTDDMKALQFDQKNLQAEELLPLLLPTLTSHSMLREIDQEAIRLLEEWNFEDDPNLVAPLIHHLWIASISDVLFEERIDPDMFKHFRERRSVVDGLIRLASNGEESLWIESQGGYQEVVFQAFQRAVNRGIEMQGPRMEKWSWGDFHQLTVRHPLGAIAPLHLLFNPTPQPVGGSAITVMAAAWNVNSGEVNHGAGWRGVMDLSDLSESYHVVVPGQSGHVTSRWYDNQMNDWVNGKYHSTNINPETYQKTSKKLELLPTD
ncbi:penicillin acylase family protein [Alkalihalobacterium sp. APHAB7]|uniref:penicillin acylase family protein n=1 Tax=Alkalihalobacterium sp. APHAB7 TaxID=3402081 RepID=UPI003AAA78D5